MREKIFDNGARLVDLNAPVGGPVQATNFQVHWAAHNSAVVIDTPHEAFALFLLGAGTIRSRSVDLAVAAGYVALVPAGRHEISAADHPVAVLTTDPSDRSVHDERVAPIGVPFKRHTPLAAPQLWSLDAMDFPPGNPRLKFLQAETLSINLVAYDGARPRSALSPHSHADIEQGTLALAGDHIHHLRTPWGPNADAWCEDVHAPASGGTLVVIPPEVIHTTEGVNGGRHLLVDIYAPPRRDFIAKNWVANAADYQDPGLAGPAT